MIIYGFHHKLRCFLIKDRPSFGMKLRNHQKNDEKSSPFGEFCGEIHVELRVDCQKILFVFQLKSHLNFTTKLTTLSFNSNKKR